MLGDKGPDSYLRWSKRDFPGGPVAKTPRSQSRGPGLNPWSGNWFPRAATKDPTCRNEDSGSLNPQLRPDIAK